MTSRAFRSKFSGRNYGRAYGEVVENGQNIGVVKYLPRYTQLGIARYGANYAVANAEQRAARAQDGYVGAGAYRRRRLRRRMMRGRGGYIGSMLGKLAGGFLGGPEGAMIGSQLGDKAGDWLYDQAKGLVDKQVSKASGSGAYAVNDLVSSGGTTFEVPEFVPHADGTRITISNREYVGDVFGPDATNTLQVESYDVNPGLNRTFPWLSQIACNFEEFTLHQCIFTYKTTVAEFAAQSGQMGSVIGVTQYNVNNPPFTEKRAMLEYDGSKSCKTSENLMIGVECDPSKLSGSVGKYIRSAPVPMQSDKSLYDHGQFNIGITDIPATYINQQLGELWVSYTVELRKPRFFSARGFAILRDTFCCVQNNTSQTPFSVRTNNFALMGQQNNLGCKLLLPPAGGELLSIYSTGTAVPTADKPVPNTGLPVLGAVGNPVIPLSEYCCVRIVFPPAYSGTCRVVLSCQMTGAAPAPNNDPLYLFGATGNVIAVKDILTTNPEPGFNREWVGQYNSRDASLERNQLIILDVRVSVASNGYDNVLYVCCQSTNLSYYQPQVFVSIDELNTSGNYSQMGNNDAPIFVNAAGVAVLV